MESLALQEARDNNAKMETRLPTVDFAYVTRQRGMFSYTGLTKAQVARLRDEFSVYAVDTGRICVAALNSRNVDYVADAIADPSSGFGAIRAIGGLPGAASNGLLASNANCSAAGFAGFFSSTGVGAAAVGRAFVSATGAVVFVGPD